MPIVDFYFALIVPTSFCVIFGLDLVWIEFALKKGYRGVDFFTLNGWKGLKDPDFKRGIRLLGYSSLVLWISVIIVLTGIEFYQLSRIQGDPPFLSFFIPFIMFLSPLQHPIVFFLIWQTIIFVYGYNVSTKEPHSKHIKGFIAAFIVFNIFWIIVVLYILFFLFLPILSIISEGLYWGKR